MKSMGVELIAQAVMALVVALAAGFVALTVALPMGGTAFGVAPEAHLNLVSGLLCPSGSQVVFEEGGDTVTYSGGTPTYGTAISVVCEDANGVRTELPPDQAVGPFFGAMGLILGGYFLACFGPLFVLGVIIGGIVIHKVLASTRPKPPAQPSVTSF